MMGGVYWYYVRYRAIRITLPSLTKLYSSIKSTTTSNTTILLSHVQQHVPIYPVKKSIF